MRLSTTLNLYTLRGSVNHTDLAPKAVGICKAAGFDAIDVMLKEVVATGTPREAETWADSLLEAMNREGMQASQCHGYFENTRQMDDTTLMGPYRDKILQSISLASQLGISEMVVHPLPLMESRGITFEQSLAVNAAFFQSLDKALATCKVHACLENIFSSEYDGAESLIRLRERIGAPELYYFCWDTGHANLVEKVRDSQDKQIRQLGPLLHATHIQDNHGAKDEHLLPMMGTINWLPVVKALDESGYQGDFTYETAQNVNHLPDDDILRLEMIRYSVHLGRYLLESAR